MQILKVLLVEHTTILAYLTTTIASFGNICRRRVFFNGKLWEQKSQIMNYKFKSLFYFIAFVISVIIYYTLSYNSFNEFENTKAQVVETELSDDNSENQDTKSYLLK